MPQVKNIIQRIQQRNYAETSMFWWVLAQKRIVPSVSIEKILYNYYKETGQEEFNVDSDRVIYYRMLKEYYGKDENTETDKELHCKEADLH